MVRNIGIMAVVAILLVASGATAAQVITGAQIRDNSVSGKDVRNKSLSKQDFKGSVTGPRGLQGPRGAPGARGAAGRPGATEVTVRGGSVGLGSSTATCNPGERAVGGGGVATQPTGYLTGSAPVQGAGETPTAWRASAAEASPDRTTVEAWVICAAP